MAISTFLSPALLHYQITGTTALSIDGDHNLFVGVNAGPNSTSGNSIPSAVSTRENTFVGASSGTSNSASRNTFLGSNAGKANTSGTTNTFSGSTAGSSNTTGSANTFSGESAGTSNLDGSDNTFSGTEAGHDNTSGSSNTFSGHLAGRYNITGKNNTFLGESAGTFSTGNSNIFLGQNAGVNNKGADNDIYVGNSGCPYPCLEPNTIRIGTLGTQTDTYVQGIYNSPPGTSPRTVCVAPSGKLWGAAGGCPTSSSRRFKDQILDMGDGSSKLFELRPVTYFYKPEYDDGSHLLQYGLVAEEVAKVYPDMAGYDEGGQPSSVKYQLLAPMLLNELQKQHTVVTAQQEQIRTQAQQIQDLQQRLLRMESLLENK